MVPFATALALVFYLLPIVGFAAVRSSRDRSLASVALDVPTAVGADLILALALGHFMTLSVAVLAARSLWAVAIGIYWQQRIKRGDPPQLPRALDRRVVLIALFCAAASAFLSMQISVRYWVWDREWHAPMVSLMRHEKVPFANFYEPLGVLRYHHAGDAFAAVVQILSLQVISSSRALSVAHDLLFALIGLCIALFCMHFERRRLGEVLLVVGAFLLAGPVTLAKGPQQPFDGHTDLNFYTLSYRPHVVLAGMMIVGFAGAVLARIEDSRVKRSPMSVTVPALFASTAVLALTDEFTILILGAGLGAAWLLDTEVVGDKIWQGIVTLVGMLATIILSNRLFGGALSPGGPETKLHIMPARLAGFGDRGTKMLLTHPDATGWLISDTLPVAVAAAAIAWVILAKPSRRRLALFAFSTVITGVTAFMFLKVQFNHRDFEAHRAMTAARQALPFVALAWLPGLSTGHARAATFVGASLGSFSSLGWLIYLAPGLCQPWVRVDDYNVDCRKALGAAMFEKPEPVLATEMDSWFRYSTCRPVFTSSSQPDSAREKGAPKSAFPWFGTGGMREVRTWLPQDAPMAAICRSSGEGPLCTPTPGTVSCRTLGARVTRCELSPTFVTSLVGPAR